jgi:serine/threonine-protein kinase RsbW
VGNTVASALRGSGFTKRDVFAVRLALDEALANAIQHGHGGDLTKAVQVRWRVSRRGVLLRVRDQGPGFDPSQIPDPLAPEALERESGRGLLLMRSSLTWVRYNRRGNAVTLCKRRTHP